MPYHLGDTICAIATASGGAARGIVRISGPEALTIADRLFEPCGAGRITQLRHATGMVGSARINLDSSRHTMNPPPAPPYKGGEFLVPCDLFVWPTARSYTREPIAELHTIGSPPLLESLVAATCRAGARLAQPGEFTLRAFLAGRIDLTQAEAVLGVIDAHSQNELAGALSQLAGGIARPLNKAREDLLQLLAELEAGLDFVEEDIEFVSPHEVAARLTATVSLLDDIQRQLESRHAADGTLQVVLTGAPNVGKSSLFNALVTRFGIDNNRSSSAPAIVSPQSGTTRDYLTAMIDVAGLRCELVDTAGIESSEPTHDIDRRAQHLATECGAAASVRVLCVEAVKAAEIDISFTEPDLVVLTKSDAMPRVMVPPITRSTAVPCVRTSSITGEGLDDLVVALQKLLARDSIAGAAQMVTATAERCRESIRQADASLRRAIDVIAGDGGDELASAEIRAALTQLGEVVGAIYTDDLLDRIFSKFCIGK